MVSKAAAHDLAVHTDGGSCDCARLLRPLWQAALLCGQRGDGVRLAVTGASALVHCCCAVGPLAAHRDLAGQVARLERLLQPPHLLLTREGTGEREAVGVTVGCLTAGLAEHEQKQGEGGNHCCMGKMRQRPQPHQPPSNQQAHLFQRGCRGNGCLDGCDLLRRGARARCCSCWRCRRLSGPRYACSCLRLWKGARWRAPENSARVPSSCTCDAAFQPVPTNIVTDNPPMIPPPAPAPPPAQRWRAPAAAPHRTAAPPPPAPVHDARTTIDGSMRHMTRCEMLPWDSVTRPRSPQLLPHARCAVQ